MKPNDSFGKAVAIAAVAGGAQWYARRLGAHALVALLVAAGASLLLHQALRD